MSSIEQLIRDYLRFSTSDSARWRQLLDEDVVVELSYGPSAGMPARVEGRDAVVAGFTGLLQQLQGLQFLDVVVHLGEDSEEAFAFYRGEATGPTGKPYQQDYLTYFRRQNDKVVLFREFFDPVRLISALTP